MTDQQSPVTLNKPTAEQLLDACMQIVAAGANAAGVDFREEAERCLRNRHRDAFARRLAELGDQWGGAVAWLHRVAADYATIAGLLAKLRRQTYIDAAIAELAADVVQAACQEDGLAKPHGQWCPIDPLRTTRGGL